MMRSINEVWNQDRFTTSTVGTSYEEIIKIINADGSSVRLKAKAHTGSDTVYTVQQTWYQTMTNFAKKGTYGHVIYENVKFKVSTNV